MFFIEIVRITYLLFSLYDMLHAYEPFAKPIYGPPAFLPLDSISYLTLYLHTNRRFHETDSPIYQIWPPLKLQRVSHLNKVEIHDI